IEGRLDHPRFAVDYLELARRPVCHWLFPKAVEYPSSADRPAEGERRFYQEPMRWVGVRHTLHNYAYTSRSGGNFSKLVSGPLIREDPFESDYRETKTPRIGLS